MGPHRERALPMREHLTPTVNSPLTSHPRPPPAWRVPWSGSISRAPRVTHPRSLTPASRPPQLEPRVSTPAA